MIFRGDSDFIGWVDKAGYFYMEASALIRLGE